MENIKETITVYTNENDKGKRIDSFLNEIIDDATRSYIQKIIDNGYVEITGKKITKNGNKLKGIERIVVNIPEDETLDVIPENLPLNIIYEDKDIVVINKAPDMVVHPAHGNYNGTLVNALLYHIKDLSTINGVIRPGIVHRLDKDTSGVIVVAKNDEAHSALSDMFKEKTLEKVYICIAKGIFKDKYGRIETLIGRDIRDRKKMAVVDINGKNAVSNYEILDEGKNFSLVKVRIETGRTHQIRVHMKYLNHPILGDNVYGSSNEGIKRQMLHAYRLKFTHPVTKKEMVVTAEIPEDFKKAAKFAGVDIDKIKF
ncbi:RluA family pseudouridine synthase [Fusobacterium sp.]|uniref:RluA family pseudouridine synthase n=1 Tax=Fusobacterium sp. TaxID=68766 RepID=UPI0028FDF214|nr:RluA family pseudouridine synthase [Fusobacterium sp.]MDU1910051.1 RluA family pseudouridine synthase [Fusobacterium sp.]